MKKMFLCLAIMLISAAIYAAKPQGSATWDRIVKYRIYVVENGRNKYLDNGNWAHAPRTMLSQVPYIKKHKGEMIALVYGRRVPVRYNN